MFQTIHKVFLSDSRSMDDIDEDVHLILTSPPYWNIKKYPRNPCQLGNISDYHQFLAELKKVISECFRVLVEGGRLCMVVGDICLARRQGRHRVIPFHSHVIQLCLDAGFDYLAPIILYKIANVTTEAKRKTYALGRYLGPNSIIKNDIEYVLIFRKPGGYRSVDKHTAVLSRLEKHEFTEYFRQVWWVNSCRVNHHPAPFSLELAKRLVKMFSYVGDTVLDPFLGSGTTTLAAIYTSRNSVGYEVERSYVRLAKNRIRKALVKDKVPYRLIDMKQSAEGIVIQVNGAPLRRL
ncbi:MAG: site-specific DNA-methyltransferase [Candidatus Brockarchaeota archaeon]|nr:site-specific DNA-methyltransferase [Candidatus Brockarchaeota archaeon]